MALSAFDSLKHAVSREKLRMHIIIDANSVIRSTAPQTPIFPPLLCDSCHKNVTTLLLTGYKNKLFQ
jgi:hypothetical protein